MPLIIIILIICLYAGVVRGLNNFRVGKPSSTPVVGKAVVISDSEKCGGDQNDHATTPGSKRSITCIPTLNTQYVVVQSLDTEAEKLCLAEVTVYKGKPM